jgi:16S rRNA (guanine(966)-N(2))-methyltransferase RsmD
MRVIAGTAKGLRLTAPKGDKVRPAADKVKGAIFNILGDLDGVRVLDLFAGSGSVGIEALSRGASECIFVESDRHTASFIQRNLITADLTRSGRSSS